jgi:hypothetical protein
MSKLIFLLFFLASSAHAYKIAIYTDQANNKKAKEVVELFKKTYPFNQYQIDFEIKTISASELKCTSQGSDERYTKCNSEMIAKEAASKGIDQAIIVKSSNKYGGSGGSIPIITSGSPANMALHEYLHTLGLADEYPYPSSEANYYCKQNDPQGTNLTVIEPKASGYPSDSFARSEHMRQIPWGLRIKPETLITSGQTLGTGKVSTQTLTPSNNSDDKNRISTAIGLYAAPTCLKATPPVHMWQPNGEITIMNNLTAGLGSGNEVIVIKALETRGVRKKFLIAERDAVHINSNSRNMKPLIEGQKPVQSSKISIR